VGSPAAEAEPTGTDAPGAVGSAPRAATVAGALDAEAWPAPPLADWTTM
jgi:hypothetical protein